MAKRKKKPETKESLMEEYVAAVAHKRQHFQALPKGVTVQRLMYLRERIPQLLDTTDDLIWAIEQFNKAYSRAAPYMEFLRPALAGTKTVAQLTRIFPLIPKSYTQMRSTCIQKAVAFSADKHELAEFVLACWK